MLSQNVTGKSDQPIVYDYRLLNKVKQIYNTTHKEALAMVFSLHKFKHYLLGNKVCFLCRSYGIGLFGQQTTSLGRITKWLLSFLKYDFTIVYKP
jgi:hypothetical protein